MKRNRGRQRDATAASSATRLPCFWPSNRSAVDRTTDAVAATLRTDMSIALKWWR